MAKESNKDGPQLYLRCEWCGKFFEYNGGKRRRYCTQAHKQAAWRRAGGDGNSAGPIYFDEASELTDEQMKVIAPVIKSGTVIRVSTTARDVDC